MPRDSLRPVGARAARRSPSRLRTRRPRAAHALAAGALLLAAATVAAPSLAAQSRPEAAPADSGAVLRGTVASAVTGRPLHPARVVHLETGSGAMTDVPGLHIDELTVQDFMAMEIYRGPGETPPRFSRGQRYSGVIEIWTHDGRP